MGLLLSILLSYAGGLEAIECIRHIINGIVAEGDPNFEALVQYYTQLLQKSSNHSSLEKLQKENYDAYLCLSEDSNGKIVSATIKYSRGNKPDSTALLFSTKISSFGQDSVESTGTSLLENGYGNKRTPERYISTTQSIDTDTEHKLSVSSKNKSPTQSIENISDPSLAYSFDDKSTNEANDSKEKLTWHYRPLSPIPQATLPEIHFQPFDDKLDFQHDPETPLSEDFLRSLDGVKNRPLQRSDPSGRRRSYKKRHSSSSTSSRESRASREEELRAFTSLEEAEFLNNNELSLSNAPNLSTRSHSRSRSKENVNETKQMENERWSLEESVEDEDSEDNAAIKPRLKHLPKLDSFEEEKAADVAEQTDEVTENDDDDFWGKNDD